MMTKNNLLFIIFLFTCTSIFAQRYKKGKEKIRVYKIAHITQELELTEKEAQRFWPVYNKYDKKLMQLRRGEIFKLKKKIKEAGGINVLTEKQAKHFAIQMIALQKEEQKITIEFYDKLQKVLSYKKIIQLNVAEYNFKRKLLRKYRGFKAPKKEE